MPMTSGTCAVNSTRGMLNQRSKYSPPRNGVATLTATSAASVSGASQRIMRRACACVSPSVFQLSQQAPSRQ